jgi:NitT/TauT family transport system substrate-binding protein
MEETMTRFLLTVCCAIAALSANTGERALAKDIVRVGYGPFLSGGGFFIARDKGYFDKMGITIESKQYFDGSMAVPSMISGELDVTNLPASANLFNSIAKGAPLVIFADWGHNRVGHGYTVFSVSQALYDQGVRKLEDLGKLKGKKVGVGAIGSINQYNAAQALLKAGLDPAKDVEWVVNIPQPDLMKMLGQGQVDATDLSYNLGYLAQLNKMGRMIATGDQIAPDFQIAAFVVRKDFLQQNFDVMVRFTMAYLQGIKEFNAAAQNPEKYPEIVGILAKNTTIDKPELVKSIAPHWAYLNEDAMPQVDSIMAMQDFWSGKYFHFVEQQVSRDQLFDLTVIKKAKERFDREKPF